jgi:glycosyltransferase involved in cell wall biosynthesis
VRVLALDRRGSAVSLRTTRPDIAIVDTIAADLAAPHLRGMRRLGTRVLALALMRRGAARLARQADRTIAVSAALAAELAVAGIERSKLFVISPGIDRVPRATPAGDVRVLCVANLSAAKGIHTLLAAARRVPEVTVDLVGDALDARYAARVRRIAAAPELEGRVREHGPLSGRALARQYQHATLFALPSTRESYGMAVAQALAHGLPVIACDIPATREVAAGAAVLVPPGRVSPLVTALRRLARDRRARSTLARRARARARSFNTWGQTERQLVRAVRFRY